MNLSQVTSEIVGKPFARGSEPAITGQGFDCVTMAFKVLEAKGAATPVVGTYKDKTLDEWVALFMAGDEAKFDVAIDYIIEKGAEKIPASKSVAGDIFLLRLKRFPEKLHFFGINGGNNNVLIATEEKGIRAVSIEVFIIEEAYRWEQK